MMDTRLTEATAFYRQLGQAVDAAPIDSKTMKQIDGVLKKLSPDQLEHLTAAALERIGVPSELRPFVTLQALQRRFPSLNLADVGATAGAALAKVVDFRALKAAGNWASEERMRQLLQFHADFNQGPPYPAEPAGEVASDAIRAITDPKLGDLRAFKQSKGMRLELGQSLTEHGEVHHYHKLEIIDHGNGTFGVGSWQLDGRSMQSFDFQTLSALEQLAKRALTKAHEGQTPDRSGAVEAFLSRFVRTIDVLKQRLEARYNAVGVAVENAVAPLRGAARHMDKAELDNLVASLSPPPASASTSPPGAYPKSEYSFVTVDGLRRIVDPQLGNHRAFIESGGKKLIVGSCLYEGEPHYYQAVAIEKEGREFVVKDGYRTDGVPMKSFDHDTLVELLRLADQLIEKTAPPKDAAIAIGTPRAGSHAFLQDFRRAVVAAKSEIENGAELQAMRPFLALNPELTIDELRDLISRNITAPELASLGASAFRDGLDIDQVVAAVQKRRNKRTPPLGRSEVVSEAASLMKLRSAALHGSAQVAMALVAQTEADRAGVLHATRGLIKRDEIPVSNPAFVARALVDPKEAEGVMKRGAVLASDDEWNLLFAGWGLLAAAAHGPGETKLAYGLISNELGSEYIHEVANALPAAAILARGHQKEALFERAKTTHETTRFWATSNGALLAMALCAEPPEQRREVFELAKANIKIDQANYIETGLVAMALAASNEAERQEAMATARPYLSAEWNEEIRQAAIVSMGIAACPDPALARRAGATLISGK